MSGERKIAILSPIYSDAHAHGGITPVVRNLAHGFVRAGVQVDLLVRLPKERFHLPKDIPAGLRIIDLRSSHRLTTAISVAKYLHLERPDLLLTAGHRFNIAGLWAGRMIKKIPIYISVHNTVSAEAGIGGGHKLRKRLRSVSRFYPWAQGIITVSGGVAADLLMRTRLPKDKIKVIYNPVVDAALLEKAQDESELHPWLREDIPVIVGLGRLARQKAFDHLLRVFAKVNASHPCRLLIMGEGTERKALEQLAQELGIADRLALPGFVANPYPAVRRARVLALSSIFEGCPTVPIEAMALGTPVVATDCPSGPDEILAGGKYGELVPMGDVQAMADALLRTLAREPDPALLQEAVQRFQVERVVQEYLTYLGLNPVS